VVSFVIDWSSGGFVSFAGFVSFGGFVPLVGEGLLLLSSSEVSGGRQVSIIPISMQNSGIFIRPTRSVRDGRLISSKLIWGKLINAIL